VLEVGPEVHVGKRVLAETRKDAREVSALHLLLTGTSGQHDFGQSQRQRRGAGGVLGAEEHGDGWPICLR